VLGVALWLFGWRWHRFWVVAGISLAAGLIGLNSERVAGGQVIAVGVLLAVAAGMMALELAKVFAFIAGGIGAWLAVQWVLPQAQELWAVFLSGGLFGLLLYRLWTMLLTGLMGTLLAAHSGLLLLERGLHFDAVAWAAANMAALNGVTVGVVILGILLQAVSAPDEDGEAKDKPEKDEAEKPEKKKKKDREKDEAEDGDDRRKSVPWWKRVFPGKAA
jgi:ribosomal protein L12E/L44/L45/RPP1/RPP2